MSTVKVHGDLDVQGSIVLGQDNVDFPLNPRPGTLVIKGMNLFAYLIIGGMQTWYPLVNVNKNNSHVHNQAVPSVEWTINHNLDVAEFWYQVQDELGNITYPAGITKIDTNTYKVQFSTPVIGTVITVATSNVVTDKVTASAADIGGNVHIDSTGIQINGQYVLSSADIDAKIAVEVNRAIAADTTLTNTIAAEVSRAVAEDTTLAAAITGEASNRTAAITAAIAQEVIDRNAAIAAGTQTVTTTSNTWTAQQVPKHGVLTDAANVDWDGDVHGQVAALTLGGNRVMNAPMNIRQFASYALRVSQDNVGGRILAWNNSFKYGTNGAPTLSTAPNAVDILVFMGGAGNTLEFVGSRIGVV